MDFQLTFVEALRTGGNASTMLVEQGRRKEKRLARITWTYDLEEQIRMHKVLFREMPNWTVAIREYHDFGTAKPPKEIADLLKKTTKGAAMLAEMQNDPERKCGVIIMDYAELGDLAHFKHITEDQIRFIISEVLLFLYCAQTRLGFQHGDLHSGNVVIAMESGVMQPKIIDYDYGSFYTQRKLGKRHYLSTSFLLPPEIIDTTRYADDAVLGSIDIWSLGLMLISRFFGTTSIINRICAVQGCSEKEAIYLLQTTLDINPYNTNPGTTPTAKTQEYLQKIRDEIVIQRPDVHAVCKLMLHSMPVVRTFNGHVYRYFDMPYFQKRKDMESRLRKMVRLRLKVGTNDRLPAVTDYERQVQNLIESGIQLVCVNCDTAAVDLHVCRNTGHVVCGMQCWNEING